MRRITNSLIGGISQIGNDDQHPGLDISIAVPAQVVLAEAAKKSYSLLAAVSSANWIDSDLFEKVDDPL
jgi:hypothetical protein